MIDERSDERFGLNWMLAGKAGHGNLTHHFNYRCQVGKNGKE